MVSLTTERRTALFIAPVTPSDRGNGLAMRTGFLLDSYARCFDVDLVIIPVAEGNTAEITPFVVNRVRRATILTLPPPDTHFALISSIVDVRERLAAFRQYGRPSLTASLTADIQCALAAWVADERYAIIHVSRLYLSIVATAWMKLGSNPRCAVLDCDEDDAHAYRRLAALERKRGRYLRASWAEAEAEAFRLMAVQWLPRFDLVLAASASEARSLKIWAGQTPVNVVPNVVPPASGQWLPRRGGGSCRNVIFVGTLSYLPNIDAVMWFASRIWPRLRSAVPFPVRLTIIGQGAPRQIVDLGRRFDILVADGVKDVAPFYQMADLSVVPIRAGGGTRIKLLESASYRVPVVATRFGAAGTIFRTNREILLADDERAFSRACSKLLINKRLASRLASWAYATVRREYDFERCARRLGAQLLMLVGRGRSEDDRSVGQSR